MLEILTAVGPIMIAMVIYFARLESRMSKILTDLCWIKKELVKCRPILEESSR